MAEKSAKKKTKKAAKTSADASVLGNLKSTRPTRLGGDRRAPARAAATKTATATKPAAAKKSTTSRATAKKPKAATAPKTATAPKPSSAPPAGWQVPDQDGRKGGPPSGTEIVTTAVQAAGELAQVGLTVTGQLLKRAAGRLPRP